VAFTFVTITHTFETADGSAAAGSVDFRPIVPIHNDSTVIKKTVTATLSGAGGVAQLLAANTDPGTTPTGTVYEVTERITGQATLIYYIQVPHDAGTPIDLRSLAGWVGGTGGSGTVSTINGESPDGGGNVVLSASDVGAQPADGDLDGLAALGNGVPIRASGTWGLVSGTPDGTKFLRDDGSWQTTSGTVYTDENARDAIGAALVAGSNVTIIPDDTANTITISAAATGSSGIPASTVDAKGDLIAGTANDTVARRSVGTDGQALLADSAQTTGMAWGAPVPADASVTNAKVSGSAAISADKLADGTTNKVMTATERTKLAGITGSPGWFNVKDYGAVGDGVANDTTAINNALAAVPAGGGVVYLPAGRYKITTSLSITKQLTVLQGAGAGTARSEYNNAGGTRIEVSGALSTPAIQVSLTGLGEPLGGCALKDLTVDGGGTATGVGVHWRSYNSYIERVNVYDFGSHGFHFNGTAGWNLYDSMVTQIRSANNGGAGIYMDVGATDMQFSHCVVFVNSRNLEYRDGSSSQFTNCHFYDATLNGVLINGGGSRTKFMNCKIEGAQQHLVNIDTVNGGTSELQFIGCSIARAGEATTNTYDLVFVQASSGTNGSWKTMFVGCSFDHYGGGNIARYQLNLGSVAQVALVAGCNFGDSSTFGTAAVNNASSGTFPAMLHGNGGDGYKTRRAGTATVASGSTTVAVTHGVVGVTPVAAQVKLTPTNSLGNATKWWVTSVGATTFTINVNTDPGATTATFAWEIDA
jgi:hypothetical protein